MDARRVLIRVGSNLTAYQVNVSDGCNTLQKRVTGRRDCLCVCTDSPYLRIIASADSNVLYFWVDTTCNRVFDLYFNFPSGGTTPSTSLNVFTLTDEKYGLPVDGALLFVGR